MGRGADLTVQIFGGVLGMRPWVINQAEVVQTSHLPASSRTKPITVPGISNPYLRDMVIQCGDKLAGDYFWERPAAKGNRYHPQVSCGDGGLVRHTLYACWWGWEIMRQRDILPNGASPFSNDGPTLNHDAVLAALIVHDMLKEGDPQLAHLPERQGPNAYKLICGCHGVDMANAIYERVLNRDASDRDRVLVLHGVAGHMGRWTLPEKYDPARIGDPVIRHFAEMVATADYCASRKADSMMQDLNATGGRPPNANPPA